MYKTESPVNKITGLFYAGSFFKAVSLRMVKKPLLYQFTLVMTGLYILLGLFIMFAPQMKDFLPGWKHWVLGIMFIGYAFLRFKRLQSLKRSMENENDK